MNSAIERLLSLRVGDIMNRQVVPIESCATIADAAKTLAEHDITGAPVVDGGGRCVGVLSVTDLALNSRRAVRVGESAEAGLGGSLSAHRDGDPAGDGVHQQTLVEDHMSPLVQTVDVELPIMAAARVLCREHIHRLIIVDAQSRPVGVVSSLDFVAAMVAAVEE
jgi:CBS domain-containing protein